METKKLDTPMTMEEITYELTKKKQEHINKVIKDFNDNGILHIFSYKGVSKFKSVRRAIRRGKVDLFTGVVYPRRPFNNRKPTNGRRFNESRKEIYGRIIGKAS